MIRAIGHTEFGGPQVLHEVEVPEPLLGNKDVRVRVSAAAVNPTDSIRRSGMRAQLLETEPRPWVPGMDFAGIVEDIGKSANTTLMIGDRVMGVIAPEGNVGAYSEVVVVAADSVVKAPTRYNDLEAATLPMTGLTAIQSLDRINLPVGSVLGITGAAGVYGGYMIQLAKHRGLKVVADANERDYKLVEELGADEIVQRGDDVAKRFREICPSGLDALADGALLNQKVIDAVKSGGDMVTLRHFKDESREDIRFHPVHIKHYLYEKEKLEELRFLADEGVLSPRHVGSFPAEDAAKAHAAMDRGGSGGRFVLSFAQGWGR